MATKIFYSTPYKPGNIGGGINEFIELLPEDAWICIRDGDTIFLNPEWGKQIVSIVENNSEYDLIGCITNRLRASYQLYGGSFSNDGNIAAHVNIASRVWQENGPTVEPVNDVVAGMFLLLPKKTWLQHKFKESSIYFDQHFSKEILKAGGKIGIAQGLYLFHLYRWGSLDPFNNISHLL